MPDASIEICIWHSRRLVLGTRRSFEPNSQLYTYAFLVSAKPHRPVGTDPADESEHMLTDTSLSSSDLHICMKSALQARKVTSGNTASLFAAPKTELNKAAGTKRLFV